jgi:hypothetical protein
VWDYVHTALSPQGDELSPRGSWGICVPVLPEGLTQEASVAHVFTGMANHSLISVGQLCNEGYCVTFRIDGIKIYNSAEKAILKGQQDLNTG